MLEMWQDSKFILLRFSEQVFPNICSFPTFLYRFFQNEVSNNAQSSCFMKIVSTKNFIQYFQLLVFIRAYFFKQFANMIFMFFLFVFMLHFRWLFSQKVKKSKWSIYCLLRVRKSLFCILLEKDYWKLIIVQAST